MSTPPTEQQQAVHFKESDPAASLVTVVQHHRTIKMYGITDRELANMMKGYTSIHITLFGLAFGAFLTLYTSLRGNVQLPEALSDRYSTWIAIAVIVMVYALAMAIRDFYYATKDVNEIKLTSSIVNVSFSVSQSETAKHQE